ncbi:hypothetical protein, partial [Nocardia xishanensis]
RLRHARCALAHDSLTAFAHACASLALGSGMRDARWHMIRSLRSLMPAPPYPRDRHVYMASIVSV